MLLFISQGQFGNQLFQYSFLQNMKRPGEKLIVYGFADLIKIFKIEDTVLLKKNKLSTAIVHFVLYPILILLAKCKIFSTIYPNKSVIQGRLKENGTYTIVKGLIDKITVVQKGIYIGQDLLFPDILTKIKFVPFFIEQAKLFLDRLPKENDNVFIHIRRGDFTNYTVFGKSSLLPVSYFKTSIDQYLSKNKKVNFVFLSDDIDFVEKEFNYLPNMYCSRGNSFGVDFAIMTLCKGAIISASTFSYWGAYLMLDRGLVLAPKYWSGFRSKIEFPVKGFPAFATAVEVLHD